MHRVLLREVTSSRQLAVRCLRPRRTVACTDPRNRRQNRRAGHARFVRGLSTYRQSCTSDVDPPTRPELVAQEGGSRKLFVVWLPWTLVRVGPLIFVVLQRAMERGRRSVRVDSAFNAARYTEAMARVLPLRVNGDPGALGS